MTTSLRTGWNKGTYVPLRRSNDALPDARWRSEYGLVRRVHLVLVPALLLAVYGLLVRCRLRRWGATDAEVNGSYPGAEFVPGGKRGATMAVTIDAPPEHVWPWLVQLGGDRGGWYSWDRLDNGGRPSASEIHPEWQGLAVGDTVKYWTRTGPVAAWRVVAMQPGEFLGLHGLSDLRGRPVEVTEPLPRAYTEGLWGFQLKSLNGTGTRLVIGGYEAFHPAWLGRVVSFFFPIMVWVMQARMLAVLKRNAESGYRSATVPNRRTG